MYCVCVCEFVCVCTVCCECVRVCLSVYDWESESVCACVRFGLMHQI